MPHKHKRKRDQEEDSSNFNVPPGAAARTLSVHQKHASVFTAKDTAHKAKKQRYKQKNKGGVLDDTPKSFARLMSFQKTGRRAPSGLDDGSGPKKKAKSSRGSTNNAADAEQTETASSPTPSSTQLKILPGERLSDFAIRVDQSLPLAAVPKHQTRVHQIPGLEKLNVKPHLTRHNKRLARMQDEWRATEAHLREKEAEEAEDLQDKREADDLLWLGAGMSKLGKKSKKKGKYGEDADDVDPWKQLEWKRRDQGKLARQRNPQDVVQAPPTLKTVKKIFRHQSDHDAS